MAYRKTNEPKPTRVVHTEQPKYTADKIPAITPYLRKIGVLEWCRESEPALDCTGYERLTPHTARFIRGASADVRSYNTELALQKRMLQKIVFELRDHYPELRVQDIAFIMGYSVPATRNFMSWIPPEGY